MVTEIVKKLDNQDVTLASGATFALALLPAKAQGLLLRMFTDPYLLEREDRTQLVTNLREIVTANPQVSDLRVVLGMALCVNFEVQDAIDELQEGVRLAPDSFIAHLKMGELWMRLRVCEKAEDHTRQAALLARNSVQSDLARRQAATLRTLMHKGIKRGGYSYKGPWHLATVLRRLWKRDQAEGEALAAVETQ
jgi:hypothetical protein